MHLTSTRLNIYGISHKKYFTTKFESLDALEDQFEVTLRALENSPLTVKTIAAWQLDYDKFIEVEMELEVPLDRYALNPGNTYYLGDSAQTTHHVGQMYAVAHLQGKI
jgi:hypothetical protein